MGFGFNLFLIFILLPVTAILLLLWLLTRKFLFGHALATLWLGVFVLMLLSVLIQFFTSKMCLDKSDYQGEYVVKREFFAGEQADWQYNHFRFEITKQDSIFFYETEGQEILKMHKGTVQTTDPSRYPSARLKVKMEEPIHHLLQHNPTTYRGSWSFYLVFESDKFGNVFFHQGKWEPLD